MLLRPRLELRFSEAVGKVFIKLINPLMVGKFRKYRGIQTEAVDKAMLAIALYKNSDHTIYETDPLQEITVNCRSI